MGNGAVGNYRSDRKNDWFCYSQVVVPTTKLVRFNTDARFWFLCRKIHLVNYVNVAASSVSLSYKVKIIDTRRNLEFQSERLANHVVGGNCHSPNVLPAPILFEPNTTIVLDLDRANTRVHYCFEGEHIKDPEPGWYERMSKRHWYQLAQTGLSVTDTIKTSYRDGTYDFGILRILSMNFTTGILSNANPGMVRIREIGPKGDAWSNDELPDTNYAGVYGVAAGPRIVQPPRIIPSPTDIEVTTRSIPDLTTKDIVFDGVKFPKGTRMDEWI